MNSKSHHDQTTVEIRLVTLDGRAAFSVAETATMFGVSERLLRTRVSAREVKTFHLGDRVLISVFEILRLLGHDVGNLI